MESGQFNQLTGAGVFLWGSRVAGSLARRWSEVPATATKCLKIKGGSDIWGAEALLESLRLVAGPTRARQIRSLFLVNKHPRIITLRGLH